jgi:hypothetical protein
MIALIVTAEELEVLIRDRQTEASHRKRWAEMLTAPHKQGERRRYESEAQALRARAEELAALRETAGGE